MDYVIKRNGEKKPFDPEKIVNAVSKARVATYGRETEEQIEAAKKIASLIDQSEKDLTVEQIQDKVINLLKDGSLENNLEADQMTAGVYAAYRTAHMEARAQKDALTKVIEEKLEATNVENANANLDEHSFSGRMTSSCYSNS